MFTWQAKHMAAGSATVLRGIWASPLSWMHHSGQDLCAVLHQRHIVSPVSALPVGVQSVMWGSAVGQRCPLLGVAPGLTVLCLLPLLGAFSPVSCSVLTFATSPVTKGCAGNGLTASCRSCCCPPRACLVCPRHSGKPPPSFCYWLSACAQQARNGGKQLSRKAKCGFSVQMPRHCHHLSLAFKLLK